MWMHCRQCYSFATNDQRADLTGGGGQPVVQGVGVGQQVSGSVCQALSAPDAEHQRAAGPVQADDVRHIS